MQFLIYWEINPQLDPKKTVKVASELLEKGLFPPKGVNIIGWYGTPDNWGVLICEADTAEDVYRAILPWTTSMPGFFATLKTAPSLPIEKVLPLIAEF